LTAKFGCQLPQHESNVNRIFEVAIDCERLGYDSVWVYDHLAPYWFRSQSSLEAWSLLSAVAARTSTIRVGSLVTNVLLRNASLLAKITSTVDNLSEGRLIVGLGIGDRRSLSELRSYGYKFPPLKDRLTLLRETITVLRSMWTEPEISYDGKMVKLSHAVCQPKPRQEPGPPIWIGGKHHMLLHVIGELADGWNHWGLSKEKLLELEAYLDSKCAEFHRPAGSVTESWAGPIRFEHTDGRNEVDKIREKLESIGGKTSYFIASFPSNADHKTYEAFAEAVKSLA